jgi:hypothetical protein
MPSVPSPDARELTPLERLLRTYDAAIAACRAGDDREAYHQIATLRAAHPCDTAAALGIDALYAWCEQAVLSGDHLGAVQTLEGLRGAWQAADRLATPPLPRRHVPARQLHDDDRPALALRR